MEDVPPLSLPTSPNFQMPILKDKYVHFMKTEWIKIRVGMPERHWFHVDEEGHEWDTMNAFEMPVQSYTAHHISLDFSPRL